MSISTHEPEFLEGGPVSLGELSEKNICRMLENPLTDARQKVIELRADKAAFTTLPYLVVLFLDELAYDFTYLTPNDLDPYSEISGLICGNDRWAMKRAFEQMSSEEMKRRMLSGELPPYDRRWRLIWNEVTEVPAGLRELFIVYGMRKNQGM